MRKGYRWNLSLLDLYSGEKVASFKGLTEEDFIKRVKLLKAKLR